MVLLVFTCSVDSLRALSWSPAVTVQCKGLLDLYNESKHIGATYSQPYSFLIQQSYIPSGSSLISHLFPGLLGKSFSPWQMHCISSGFATALIAASPINFNGSHRQDQVITISQITHHIGRAGGKPHSRHRGVSMTRSSPAWRSRGSTQHGERSRGGRGHAGHTHGCTQWAAVRIHVGLMTTPLHW